MLTTIDTIKPSIKKRLEDTKKSFTTGQCSVPCCVMHKKTI